MILSPRLQRAVPTDVVAQVDASFNNFLTQVAKKNYSDLSV